MRRLSCIAALTLAATIAGAAPRFVALEASIGTNAAEVVTDSEKVRGLVDEVYIEAPTAGTTSVVTIVSVPNVGTSLTPTVLYTNGALTVADIARPRVAQTDNEGAALAAVSVAERFSCVGGTLTLRIAQTSAQTGLVFRAFVKVDR